MIEALNAGKLYGKPERRTSRSGKPFVAAKVRVLGGDDSIFVGVAAFSESAQAALLALDAGEAVALAGKVSAKAWVDRGGNARPSLHLIVNHVLTVHHAKRKREVMQQRDRSGPSAPADEGLDNGGPEGFRSTAELLTDGSANTAVVAGYLSGTQGGEDLVAVANLLNQQVAAIAAGDVTQLERMLLSQATALQAMFVDLAVRAKSQDHRHWQNHLTTLALKCAAQSRQAITAWRSWRTRAPGPIGRRRVRAAVRRPRVRRG